MCWSLHAPQTVSMRVCEGGEGVLGEYVRGVQGVHVGV